jgi:hypothetical protein
MTMQEGLMATIRERVEQYQQSERHHLNQANACAGAAQALAELLAEIERSGGDDDAKR